MSNNNMNPKHKLFGPLISLVTLFLCVGSLELTGYIWETRTAQGPLGWTLVGARRIQLEKHGSSDQPYYKFQANEYYNWEGIPVNINSLGFRGAEFYAEKPAGVYRILILGDSIAFGWEVREEDTYSKKLEQALNERNDGIRYQVINIGVPTLNLEAERNLLLQEGLAYQPDLVILDVTLANDMYGSGPNISEDQSLFQWLRDHTYGWPFLTNNIRVLLGKQGILTPPNDPGSYYPEEEYSDAYDRNWMYIEEMYNATQDAGGDFIMLIFPTPYQINSAKHPDIPQQVLTKRAELTGMDYVDLLPSYRAACEESGMAMCEGYENLLFADVWMHPNDLGHALAAKELFRKINR